jgi:hypothetical protein
MMLRIDAAFAAAFAISFLCASAASAKAETGAGDGKQQAVTGSHSHRAYTGQRLHKQTAALPWASRSDPPPPQYAWGAPPLQDPRDAYHGYFANPIDSPNYHGSADRR